MATTVLVDHVVIDGAKIGRVSDTGSGFGAVVAAEQDSRLPPAHARGAAGPLEERTRQHIGQVTRLVPLPPP